MTPEERLYAFANGVKQLEALFGCRLSVCAHPYRPDAMIMEVGYQIDPNWTPLSSSGEPSDANLQPRESD